MEATAGQKRKAKNKQWFKGQKRRKFTLCPDIKGFLCFCNYKEKEAIREAYNILNQYYEEEEVVKEETAATEDAKEEDPCQLRQLLNDTINGYKERNLLYNRLWKAYENKQNLLKKA